tara:strand:- start:5886 stop:7499 length:1614 start_codon:yes stop_codon:yes gene_type:complete
MCGIFALLNNTMIVPQEVIKKAFNNLKNRGPDKSSINTLKVDYKNSHPTITLGFHRLSINDLSDSGMQPFINELSHIYVICNGEIYNSDKLKKEFNLQTSSDSDCEVILHLYEKFGIHKTVKLLHGVFSFIVYDFRFNNMYAVVDRISVRPLFYQIDSDMNCIFASEAKGMEGIKIGPINQLKAGHILEIKNNETYGFTSYYSIPKQNLNTKFSVEGLRDKLIDAVKMRLMSDRPIGCLLSGGLDSSLIASILSKLSDKPINTFTIGFEDSTDLNYAKDVAKFIGSNHHEIIIKYKDAIEKIPEVIKHIETYDITTIRASVGMYMAAEYIKNNFEDVVIFSGEGADEILGGYLYFHNFPNIDDFDRETRRITKDLQYFDVLRADRCTAAHGLELRVPFLDQDFIKYCFEIEPIYRLPVNGMEKFHLRQAFQGYIPENILYRRKEALSDGVGSIEKPWFQHIQEWIREYFSKKFTQEEFDNAQQIAKLCKINHYMSEESLFYYKTFRDIYNFIPIPYYWMPKWQDVNDPSARILKLNL